MELKSIKWKQHATELANIFKNNRGVQCDVTIVCENKKLPVHAAVLASSEFFANILKDHPPHIDPVIMIENVELDYVQAIINYLYSGVIAIDAMKTRNFLQICQYFQIKGLMVYDIIADGEDEGERTAAAETEVQVTIEDVYEEDQNETETEDLLVFLNAETAAVKLISNEVQPEASSSVDETDEIVETAEDSKIWSSPPPPAPPSSTTNRPDSEKKPRREKKKRKCSEGYTEEQLNESMEAVCSGEVNLSTASNIYKVPKSVLWRKLKKRNDYVAHPVDEQREEAKKALLSGEPIQEVSKTFKVPLATLYRDKQRLINSGHWQHATRVRKKPDDMEAAIRACEGGMAQSEAARKFNVSKSTLWRKLQSSEGKRAPV